MVVTGLGVGLLPLLVAPHPFAVVFSSGYESLPRIPYAGRVPAR